MVERRFSTDPVIPETGAGDGRAPNIPLTTSQQHTTVEMLNQAEDNVASDKPQGSQSAKKDGNNDSDDADFDDADEALPNYARERIGSRIGLPPDEASAVDDVEEKLDQEPVVPCLFQKEVRVNDRGLMHMWGAGIHLVPVSLAGDGSKERKMHFYLRAHNVKRTGKPQPRPD